MLYAVPWDLLGPPFWREEMHKLLCQWLYGDVLKSLGADFKLVPGRAETGGLVPREERDDCCGRGGPRKCGLAPWSGLPSDWGCPGLRRGRGPVDGQSRDALGWEAPRVGALKVSGRYGRGCLSAVPGAASDGLVRPGAGLDPRGRRRIAAAIPDWAVCCARCRIRTRAHPEGGSADRSVWWGHLPVASQPPAREAEPGASWLRDCIQRGDAETRGPPGCPVRSLLWVRPPGERTIGAPVPAAREPPDADDGTPYAQGDPGRALIVLCWAGQCGIALRHPPSSTRVGGQVPLFPGAEPTLVDRTNADLRACYTHPFYAQRRKSTKAHQPRFSPRLVSHLWSRWDATGELSMAHA
ncbi:hypothetical protein NDU88_004756 [Pleurodeles waltl]|uniref:Uncharacterized protein n=1 Tax=Pleurodeles waltl TaxID=8319 RepID=A0AAV7TV86_PLEWA|nr:hypothetical protein NDU88_004756 [Pleurodeles waltl]